MKPSSAFSSAQQSLAIIMGGGAGTRLFPLTKERAKPAVPIGGKYRLVDIPISNCLNSNIRRIFVLTQFNSTSLHQHINSSYKFDHFGNSFVEILAACQTPAGSQWYQGTADAVRQNMTYFLESDYKYFVILSGDQLYRMDYRDVIRQHEESEAEITIATIPVVREAAKGFGIMETDDQRCITRFIEKPKTAELLDTLSIPPALLSKIGKSPTEELFQASMGIYVFNRDILIECLNNDFEDFGKNVIPAAIDRFRVFAYIFQGYWEDIGTIRAFYEANLNLAAPKPHYSFYETGRPIYSRPRFLPGSMIRKAKIDNAVISDGCLIEESSIDRCVVGVRSVIQQGAVVRNTVMMGADYYEQEVVRPEEGLPRIGIGKNCVINGAIIDKNARIGNGVVITPEGKSQDFDGEGFYIRDGIVVIPKNSVIPDGTWI